MTPRFCLDCGLQVVPGEQSCKCGGFQVGRQPPLMSRVYCRTCGAKSRWLRLGFENGDRPPVLHWRCTGCAEERIQYADCSNVQTMCVTVMEENLRRTGANIDHDEFLGRLMLESWRLYISWDGSRGMRFESYGFGLLRRRAYDIYRELLGRNGLKPHANALSFTEFSEAEIEWMHGEHADPADMALDFVMAIGGR